MRNAQAVGEVSLKKGLRSEKFGLRAIPDEEKPEILKAYLDQFKTTVQRYFPVPRPAVQSNWFYPPCMLPHDG